MIVGIGVDVCGVERWEQMARRRPGVLAKLLNPAEANLAPHSQAARFAAKEALAKALGVPRGMNWLDSEVVVSELGQPCFVMRGTVATAAAELGVTDVHVSLSHDAGVATAFVILESH